MKERRDDPLGTHAHIERRLNVRTKLPLASAQSRKRRNRGYGLFFVRKLFPCVHRPEDEVMDPLLGIRREVAQLIREPVRSLSRETVEDEQSFSFSCMVGLLMMVTSNILRPPILTVGREPSLPAPPEA